MRSAYDLSHVKSVSAMALTFKGKHAGNIVANWGDSRMGSTCTLTLAVFAGPLASDEGSKTDRAGGCGYDKWSAAFAGALAQINAPVVAEAPNLGGVGKSACTNYLESLGYKCLSVIG